MKLLFDQNISFRIVKLLPNEFSGSSHIKPEGLMNATDLEIWEYAKLNQFTIVTQDSDFNDIYLLKGFPPKILWIQIGNLRTNELATVLINQRLEISQFIEDEELGCFEISKFKTKF